MADETPDIIALEKAVHGTLDGFIGLEVSEYIREVMVAAIEMKLAEFDDNAIPKEKDNLTR